MRGAEGDGLRAVIASALDAVDGAAVRHRRSTLALNTAVGQRILP